MIGRGSLRATCLSRRVVMQHFVYSSAIKKSGNMRLIRNLQATPYRQGERDAARQAANKAKVEGRCTEGQSIFGRRLIVVDCTL